MLKDTKEIKLDIGCGLNPRKGYLSCDIRNLDGIDIRCAADSLPFENDSVDEIYSRHIIEHFTLKEFLVVLKEWNRVLKTGGTIYIICPNILFHLKQIIGGTHQSFYKKSCGNNDRFWGFGSLFGWQQNKYDIHKFGYYFELLEDILLEFGFEEILNLTKHPDSMEKAEWHLEVKAKKANTAPNYNNSLFYNHFDVKH